MVDGVVSADCVVAVATLDDVSPHPVDAVATTPNTPTRAKQQHDFRIITPPWSNDTFSTNTRIPIGAVAAPTLLLGFPGMRARSNASRDTSSVESLTPLGEERAP
jgi:hypothetical protein